MAAQPGNHLAFWNDENIGTQRSNKIMLSVKGSFAVPRDKAHVASRLIIECTDQYIAEFQKSRFAENLAFLNNELSITLCFEVWWVQYT